MEPIAIFKNNEEIIPVLKDWQEKLGLHDWIISANLSVSSEMDLDDVQGECEYNAVNKCASIHIVKYECYGNRISKYCAEYILIHELLHCKFALLDSNDKLISDVTHSILDDMAVGLICAKYNITKEWFKSCP